MKKYLVFLLVLILVPLFGEAAGQVSAKKIIDQINRGDKVMYENAVITGELSFVSIKDFEKKKEGFTSKKFTYHVRVPVIFKNCEFEGDVLAYYHDKDENETHMAMFHKDTLFQGCTFKQKSAFKYSKFYKAAGFPGNKYYEEALFKYAEFSEDTEFVKSVFKDDANFKYAEFPENADFSMSEFSSEANFKYTKFKRAVNFEKSRFDEECDFKYTKFKFIQFINHICWRFRK